MKSNTFPTIALLILAISADNEMYDIVSDPDKTDDPNKVPVDHISPDINCLVNNWGQFFAESAKVVNGYVHPVAFNAALDPFIIDLNHRIQDKNEGSDPFLSIKDINEFFKIDDAGHQELRAFFAECSHIPEKVGLEINELNYYFCVIVWKNGFEIFSAKLIKNKDYRKGFLRVVETTVGQIFNYKTYIQSTTLTPILNNYWRLFYSDFNEYLNLNQQYMNYNREIIIGIKETNFFFNREEMENKNLFFKFYLNNLEILRALHNAYFHFTVGADKYMNVMQIHAENFRQIISEELYGSLFYLFMRSDDVFMENFDKYAKKWNFLIVEIEDAFKKTETDIKNHVQKLIDEDETFDSGNLEPKMPDRKILDIPSEHPLLNSELDKYKARKDYSQYPLKFKKVVPSQKALILGANKNAGQIIQKEANLQNFLDQAKILGPAELKNSGRVLEDLGQKFSKQLKRTQKARAAPNSPSLEKRRAFHKFEAFDKKLREFGRDLLKVPAQPEISEPRKFFERMDELKRPLSTKKRRMTLTEFFKMYEERVVKFYGLSINIELIRTCKQHMSSKIVHFANIFCLIMQRETHLLIQQKYANSRLKTFIEKYMPFITYNFFTFFRILEEKNDLVDIAVLTLFYNEKFFSAIKLAIVSLNNLVVHYEDEYKDFYKNKLESIMMPLINNFKNVVMSAFYSFEEKLKFRYVETWELTLRDIQLTYLPLFRKKLNDLIIVPTCSEQNNFELKQQYNQFINSMNLLSFDTIRKNFLAYSKKTGLVISSQGPKPQCEEIFLMDIVEAHKREMMEKQGKGQMDDAEEYKCIKNWKLYDDVFHNVFFNTESQEIVIKSKTAGGRTEKNQFDHMMENELKRVVNYFIPSKMQEVLEKLTGDNEFNLQKCGVINNYSRSSCFAIFGNGNCREVANTIYYTRKCPAGYRPESVGCSFDCAKEDMAEDGEFCVKENPSKPCPGATLTQDESHCLKPMRRYFMYIQNPFNIKA